MRPDRLETDADWGKDGHVENREEVLREAVDRIQFDGYAAEAQVKNAGAAVALFAENGVGVGASHGDALGAALDGVDGLCGFG